MSLASLRLTALIGSIALLAAACSGGNSQSPAPVAAQYQVGVATQDAALPAAPQLPTSDQVCATLYANDNLVRQPTGALTPEMDNAGTQTGAAAQAILNPDQARIQAALDQCGAAVDAEVGAAIAAQDASDAAAQTAAAVPNTNIAGSSAQTLNQPKFHATQYAVRLAVSQTGPGNAFITGPLTLPSGVTLWIDTGVTVYATRDIMAYQLPTATATKGPFCGNTAVPTTVSTGAAGGMKAGSSSNCSALITGQYLVNSAIMGGGSIDSRAASEIVSSNALYPLMRVDETCTNTYQAYSTGTQATDGTACDNGGTFVDTTSPARHMTWWDLAWLGNMVDNGTTGFGSQSNFRMMVFNYAKNLTLAGITLNNSANFHVVPSGIDGLTVWGIKIQTPSLSASANPAGNGNPNYLGMLPSVDTAKNTDGVDPGSASKTAKQELTTGSTTTSTAGAITFDGYIKNAVFAYNYISTGDDDISPKGSNNPSPVSTMYGIDGNRGVATDRQYGFVIAHNHMYAGHGISIGSETNANVENIQVYDNSFDGAEASLRIKSDWARGGQVNNINYNNICIRNSESAMVFTPYYSTKALPASGPLYPDFHDITMSNVQIMGTSQVTLQGFQADNGEGYTNPQYPLTMTLNNVLADSPDNISVISSDADLTLNNVNLPILPSTANRVVVNGTASSQAPTSNTVDCSAAFVDFPAIGESSPAGVTWPGQGQ
jgi:polygalacturonase